MTRILDTINGSAMPAFFLSRAAGDQDANGKPVETLGGNVAFASFTGKISYQNSDFTGLDLLQSQLKRSYSDGELSNIAIVILNSTFSDIYLAENPAAIAGGTQVFYPSYGGKPHQIPAAVPHPRKPGTFLLGCGVFVYNYDLGGHCRAALRFSTVENGGGAALSLAFSGDQPTNLFIGGNPELNVAVTADLGQFQGNPRKFYDATIGTAPSTNSASDTQNGIAIRATGDVSSGSIVMRIHPDLPDYTVSHGDTLWHIAGSIYRDPSVYPHIVRANAAKLPGGSGLVPGMTLKLPDLV